MFLGYSLSHKGYKCLFSSGKIFISKDAIFNENQSPYPTLFSSPTSSSTPTEFISTTLTVIESVCHPPLNSNPSSSSSIQAPHSSPSVEASRSDPVVSQHFDPAQSSNLASSASVTVMSDDPPQLSATESPNPPQPALVKPNNLHPMVT